MATHHVNEYTKIYKVTLDCYECGEGEIYTKPKFQHEKNYKAECDVCAAEMEVDKPYPYLVDAKDRAVRLIYED